MKLRRKLKGKSVEGNGEWICRNEECRKNKELYRRWNRWGLSEIRKMEEIRNMKKMKFKERKGRIR